MRLKDLKIGDVFSIENSNSYPKLKIDGGYVDIRDEIINTSGNCDERKVEIIRAEDVQKAMKETHPDVTVSTIGGWIDESLKKFLNT